LLYDKRNASSIGPERAYLSDPFLSKELFDPLGAVLPFFPFLFFIYLFIDPTFRNHERGLALYKKSL